jgi:hypothetical protein
MRRLIVAAFVFTFAFAGILIGSALAQASCADDGCHQRLPPPTTTSTVAAVPGPTTTTVPGLQMPPHLTSVIWYGPPLPGYPAPGFWGLNWENLDPSVTTFDVWLEGNPDVHLNNETNYPGSSDFWYWADTVDVTPGVTYCWYVSSTNAVGTTDGNVVCQTVP